MPLPEFLGRLSDVAAATERPEVAEIVGGPALPHRDQVVAFQPPRQAARTAAPAITVERRASYIEPSVCGRAHDAAGSPGARSSGQPRVPPARTLRSAPLPCARRQHQRGRYVIATLVVGAALLQPHVAGVVVRDGGHR